ncbi:hypothetical protein [Granulicella paludicola]|uniref:hypothetical protein n=1 Tax=Granulicella paludicola TaxID=474951 RepID=UPI0021E0B6F9|nr:hypothetical protein [Granulicella paludicola]
MAYIITTAKLNPLTYRCFFTSTAGLFLGQTSHHGEEEHSTLLRGYLKAALDGFSKIENTLGKGTRVELLVPDEQSAARMRDAELKMFSRILKFDNADLWEEFVKRKQDFTVSILSSPDEGEELLNVWAFQRPEPGAAKLLSMPSCK